MIEVSDQQFNDIIAMVLDELPSKYTSRLDNVVITYEDEPTPDQKERLNLRHGETLFGLFEGVPLTQRSNFATTIPSRITIFKNPALRYAASLEHLTAEVKHTLWHEIAHYYGLDHDRIHEIEQNWR